MSLPDTTSQPRNHIAITSIFGLQKVYLAGGATSPGDVASATVDVFDLDTDAFEPAATLPALNEARYAFALFSFKHNMADVSRQSAQSTSRGQRELLKFRTTQPLQRKQ